MRRARGGRAHCQGPANGSCRFFDRPLQRRARRSQRLVQALSSSPQPSKIKRHLDAGADASGFGPRRHDLLRPPAPCQDLEECTGSALGNSSGWKRARHRGQPHGAGECRHCQTIQRRRARRAHRDARGRIGAGRAQHKIQIRDRHRRPRRAGSREPKAGPALAHAARAARAGRVGRGPRQAREATAKGGQLLRNCDFKHRGGDGREGAQHSIYRRRLRVHPRRLRQAGGPIRQRRAGRGARALL